MRQNLNAEDMEKIVGGADGKQAFFEGPKMRVCGIETGWLALRTEPKYDPKNEIGQLYNGEEVQIIGGDTDNGYTWVYFEKLNKSGWVNNLFIK